MALLLAAKLKETNTSNHWKVKVQVKTKDYRSKNDVLALEFSPVTPVFSTVDSLEFNNISFAAHVFTIYCTIKCGPLIPAEEKEYDEDNVGDLPANEAALFRL